MPKKILITGCVLGALAVGIGAFGAHGLKDLLEAHGRIDTFETAVKYHFYHVLALLLLGVISLKMELPSIKLIFGLFTTGIVVFSGSLYILCLTNITILGAITPIGGVLLISGWIAAAIGIKKAR